MADAPIAVVPSSSWTPARVELLLRLASTGLSSSLIAAELGGVTRNAVAGKLHRLRCDEIGDTVVRKVREPRVRKPRKRSRPVTSDTKPAPAPVAAPPEPEPPPANKYAPLRCSRMVRIQDLRHHHCRWPLDWQCCPQSPAYRFCGADRAHSQTSYCPTHHRLACN